MCCKDHLAATKRLLLFLCCLALGTFAACAALASVQFKSGTPCMGPSGKTIVCQFVDGNNHPARLTMAAPWTPTGVTVSINGGAAVPISDFVWQDNAGGTTASYYCVLALPAGTVVASGNTVTRSAPTNWVTTTANAFPTTALCNAPVTNKVGSGYQSLLPAVNVTSNHQSMQVGYNGVGHRIVARSMPLPTSLRIAGDGVTKLA